MHQVNHSNDWLYIDQSTFNDSHNAFQSFKYIQNKDQIPNHPSKPTIKISSNYSRIKIILFQYLLRVESRRNVSSAQNSNKFIGCKVYLSYIIFFVRIVSARDGDQTSGCVTTAADILSQDRRMDRRIGYMEYNQMLKVNATITIRTGPSFYILRF